jgi:hypothetical protein
MVRKIVVVLAVTALSLFGMNAWANSGSITDRHGDTRNTTPAPKADRDIVKAGYGHAEQSRRLVHWVVVDGTIGKPRDASGAIPRWLINVPGQVGDNPTCDYFVEETPPGVGPNDSDHWQFYMKECSNGPEPAVRGPVAAKRPNAHRIVISFPKRFIKSPSHYGWAVDFPSDGDQPPYDRAPDQGYKTHNLG